MTLTSCNSASGVYVYAFHFDAVERISYINSQECIIDRMKFGEKRVASLYNLNFKNLINLRQKL